MFNKHEKNFSVMQDLLSCILSLKDFKSVYKQKYIGIKNNKVGLLDVSGQTHTWSE